MNCDGCSFELFETQEEVREDDGGRREGGDGLSSSASWSGGVGKEQTRSGRPGEAA